jgi:hypothetical protein
MAPTNIYVPGVPSIGRNRRRIGLGVSGGAPPSSAPVNSSAPIVFGSTQVGQTLIASNGIWSNSPTGYTYQWKRNGSNIAGATSNTYTLVEADAGQAITCAVIASNAIGSGLAATSNSLLIDVYIVFLASIVDPTDLTTYSGGVWNAANFGVLRLTARSFCPSARETRHGARTISSVLWRHRG